MGSVIEKDGTIDTAVDHCVQDSRIAGPMCPVLDPAMVFHGNEFYMARRGKFAWLLLA